MKSHKRNPLIELESEKLDTGRNIDGKPIFYDVRIISMEPWLDPSPLNNWVAIIKLYIWNTPIAQIDFSHTLGSHQDNESMIVQNDMYSLFLFDQGELGVDLSTLPTVTDLPKVNVDNLPMIKKRLLSNLQIPYQFGAKLFHDLLYTLAIKFSELILEQPFIFITELDSSDVKKYFYYGNGEEDRFYFIDNTSQLLRIVRTMKLPSEFDAMVPKVQIETGFKQFPVRMTYSQNIGTIDGVPVEYVLTDTEYYKSDRGGALQVFSEVYENGHQPFGEIHWLIADQGVRGELLECEDLYNELIAIKPQFKFAPLVIVKITESLPKTFRSKGFGSMMYRILIQEFWNFFESPFIFTTDRCTGGSTSFDASLVWESLAKKAMFQTTVFDTGFKQNQIISKEVRMYDNPYYSVYDPTNYTRTILGIDENPRFVNIECLLSKGFDAERFIEEQMNPKRRRNRSMLKKSKADKVIRDQFGYKIPERYLTGYKGKRKEARIKEIGERREEYRQALKKYGDEDNFPNKLARSLFRPFKTDDGKSTKRSPYTKEAHKRGFKGGLKKKALEASKYYKGKIPISVLQTVFKRGKAAWSSGGHRPNQTPESWGYARVNSFLVGGKTFWTSDSDQRRKLPLSVQRAIAENAIYNPTLGVIFAR